MSYAPSTAQVQCGQCTWVICTKYSTSAVWTVYLGHMHQVQHKCSVDSVPGSYVPSQHKCSVDSVPGSYAPSTAQVQCGQCTWVICTKYSTSAVWTVYLGHMHQVQHKCSVDSVPGSYAPSTAQVQCGQRTWVICTKYSTSAVWTVYLCHMHQVQKVW